MSDFKDTEHNLYLATAKIKKLEARVEELQETIEFLDPPYGILELQDQLDAANERVEELERNGPKAYVFSGAGPELVEIGGEGFHHTTPEQINAAWKWVDYEGCGAELVLGEFGIKRCEGCGGKGKTHSRSSSMKEEPMEWRCPDCNGHGWVKE